jgi:hypothetical protein
VPKFPTTRFRGLLLQADMARSPQRRGALLEDAVALLFGAIPGVLVDGRNQANFADNEEIDITCWNDTRISEVHFLMAPFLIECKNWKSPIGGGEIAYFAAKLQTRGLTRGVIVSGCGVAGTTVPLKGAHQSLHQAISHGTHIFVLSRNHLDSIRSASDLSRLLREQSMKIGQRGMPID